MDWKYRGFCESGARCPRAEHNTASSWLTDARKTRWGNDLEGDDRTVDAVTAFVLAGGKSLRMGEDKAFLQLGGRSLLKHALASAIAAANDVWIAGSAEKFAAFGRVVEDVYPERGPLGGIHAALTKTVTDLNLIIAVDLPFVQADFLRYLVAQARETSAVVVVPKACGRLQPLCAVYRRGFADVAERSLRGGKNRIDSLFAEVRTRVIDQRELKQRGFPEEMFRNLNNREDWEQAKGRTLGPETPDLS
jgi:molybdopterin-guanine dinucleotide biosynthesis protein A